MPRTTSTQFEVIVEFMERHGDLMLPADGPNGRVERLRQWEELSSVLNIDVSGSARSAEQWKKVWSDLKCNTKKKAGKINLAACGTGGGPASKLALTDLEQRVLCIIGSQSATGLTNVEEVGVDEAPLPTPPHAALVQPIIHNINPEVNQDPTLLEGPTLHNADNSENSRRRRASSPMGQEPPRHRRASSPLPTPPRPRHRSRPQHDIASHFLQTDEHWRNLATEFVAENARLRERELQQQAQWQVLFARFLDILEQFNNNISRDNNNST